MRRNRLGFIALVAAAFAAAALAAADGPTVEDGRALWKENRCEMCHGASGKGDTAMGKKMGVADMTTAAWQESHDDETIKNVVLKGFEREKDGKQQKHQPMKGATARDAEAILKLVRSFGPTRP